MNSHTLSHSPVLQKEVLAVLFFEGVETVFDGTLGLGGHAESILQQFSSVSRYIACDLDAQHLAFAQKRLSKWESKTEFHHVNFSVFADVIQSKERKRPLVVLLDLGLCSNHVDDPKKGFSLKYDGPLSMAFDVDGNKKTAEHVINTYSEEELIRVLRMYGEEPSARRIAKTILQKREEAPITRTAELRDVIEFCTHPKDRNKTLMRVFQAIRIEVNDELDHLKKVLEEMIDVLKSGDRVGVISYHALEDRMVKERFQTYSTPETEPTSFSLHTVVAPAKAKLVVKKPIVPSAEELFENPRSRSAKLRILEKI